MGSPRVVEAFRFPGRNGWNGTGLPQDRSHWIMAFTILMAWVYTLGFDDGVMMAQWDVFPLGLTSWMDDAEGLTGGRFTPVLPRDVIFFR